MNPKFSIDFFSCSTKELIDEKAKRYGPPNNCPLWDMSHYGKEVISQEDSFQSISMALKRVCDILLFDYVPKDWKFGQKDRQFHAVFYVDENNNQVEEEDYAMWKRGGKRLWLCEVSVKILVTEMKELSHFDLKRLGF